MKNVFAIGATMAALGSSCAYAADMPVKAPLIAPAFSWSGCYIGGSVGWARHRDRGTDYFNGAPGPFSPLDAATDSGVKAGVLAGCNMQSGLWVFGVEADLEFANLSGHADYLPLTPFPPDSYDSHLKRQGSFRGRLGYAFDRNLLYVTGGLAWARISITYFQNGPPSTETFTATRTGWTVGGGIERAFSYNWTGRIEYRYADFGSVTNDTTIYAAAFTEGHKNTEHAVRAALSYKF